MTHRDEPHDDWGWGGTFEHDTRPAEGCLRSIPTLAMLSFVLSVMVTPVWTAYHVGRGTYMQKHGCFIVLSLPITIILLLVDLAAVATGSFHYGTMLFSEGVHHNPLITFVTVLGGGMLLAMMGAFWFGQRERRAADRWKQDVWGRAVSQHLERYHRDSSQSHKNKR
jgi:hypothetical protein